jgi:tetratricopeptide (TPR) repeat protein
MRLGTLTKIILLILLVLIILMPAIFLQATDAVLQATNNAIPEQYNGTTGPIITGISAMTETIGSILGGFSMMTARPMTSVAVYDYFIEKHPERADLYQLKSEALLAAGDDVDAMNTLDLAISLDPGNPLLLIKKTRLLIKSGKIPEADSIFTRILNIQTDKPLFLSAIADIALERAHYLDAYDRYSSLVNLTPNNAKNWETRSDVIFALLTIPTAGENASPSLKQTDLYTSGIKGYEQAVKLDSGKNAVIKAKIEKRSEEYVARTIQELEDRYREFRYLQPGEKPIGP